MRFLGQIFGFFVLALLLMAPVHALYEVWPVDPDYDTPTGYPQPTNAFGPRWLPDGDGFRYDWHRGMDFGGEVGGAVYSITDGEVYRVQYDTDETKNYPDSGNLIIIKTYIEGEKWYFLYAHLDEIFVEEGDEILQMQQIGSMGQSGDANTVHLHLEARYGTTCTLESQIEKESCTYRGYDPHMNPMQFLDYKDTWVEFWVRVKQDDPLKITVTSRAYEADFNRIEVLDLDGEWHIIDLNERIGFDATDHDELDNPLTDGVRIRPYRFNDSYKWRTISFTFTDVVDYQEIHVYDIWGNEAQIYLDQTVD